LLLLLFHREDGSVARLRFVCAAFKAKRVHGAMPVLTQCGDGQDDLEKG
jgi:hypothetical protein